MKRLQALLEVWREDRAFRELGRPPGWSVLFHYLGRWYDRRSQNMPLRDVAFTWAGRRWVFRLSDVYMGAFKGVFIDREYDCAWRFAEPPARILDLGGNIGFGSVFLADLFPQAELAVVEPDPRNLPLLRANLERNGVSARVFEGAVGPAAGSLILRLGRNPTCSSLEGTGMHDLADSVPVQVLTIPMIFQQAGWDRIDLLKIDIEGAEEALLAGSEAWLDRVGAILVEIHPNTTPDRIAGYLSRSGFLLERLGAGREPVFFAQRTGK
jgi:FkbM family methyltransferase